MPPSVSQDHSVTASGHQTDRSGLALQLWILEDKHRRFLCFGVSTWVPASRRPKESGAAFFPLRYIWRIYFTSVCRDEVVSLLSIWFVNILVSGMFKISCSRGHITIYSSVLLYFFQNLNKSIKVDIMFLGQRFRCNDRHCSKLADTQANQCNSPHQ
jgi:hypothetical protein